MRYLLPHAVDQSAQRYADREAVRCLDAALTWEELATRSNQLAHTLKDLGVRRGDRVGILMRKCVQCAVAIHGIMKAGAAYVPLDPAAPPARTAFVIADCGIRHLVVGDGFQSNLERVFSHCLDLTAIIGATEDATISWGDHLSSVETVSWESVAQQYNNLPPDVGVLELDLAYILYTSGSTGTPKGIMHTHRSGLSWAEVAVQTYDLQSSDRLSNHAPLHFDLSTLDYFAAAVCGATTVMIPETHLMMPASLSQLIQNQRLTVYYTVPLSLIQLLHHGALASRDLSSLRWILFGGEPMPPKHLRDLMLLLPHVRFSNVYGPTETNGCLYYNLPEPPEDDTPLPIGRLYANAEALVVDGEGQHVEGLEIGELLIRSPTRMAGYWNHPDMTDRVTHRRVVAENLQQSFHRTGDLVRRRADGGFEFHGRKDRQIKTRGHRVELDEVESCLTSHLEVTSAAALAVPHEDSGLLIEAVAATAPGSDLTVETLMAHLKEVLPPYALPARIELRNDLPRTSTGKIDRVRLQHEVKKSS